MPQRAAQRGQRLGLAAALVENLGEPLEDVARLGSPAGGEKRVGPTRQRSLVAGRAAERARVGVERLVDAAEPQQNAARARVRQWPLVGDRRRGRVMLERLLEAAAQRRHVPRLERVLVLLEDRIRHRASLRHDECAARGAGALDRQGPECPNEEKGRVSTAGREDLTPPISPM
jgi:hypothetical protein